VTPSAKRQAVGILTSEHGLAVTRACRAVRLSRAAYYRPPVPRGLTDQPVIDALHGVLAHRPHWGFWKCFDRLCLLGYGWNHKRVHRVYCALRLNLPRRARRRPPARVRHPLAAPAELNQTWALDVMTDTRYDGRHFRTLNVLDEGNREGLAIDVAMSLPSVRVIHVLDELVALHGGPQALRVDNGPELTAIAHPLVRATPHRAALHPAGASPAKRLYRTLQSELSPRSAGRVRLLVAGRRARTHGCLARELQHRAAPRQPRPGPAAHLSPEGHRTPRV